MRRLAAGLVLLLVLALPLPSRAAIPFADGLPTTRSAAVIRLNGMPVIRVLAPDGFPDVEDRARVIDDRLLRLIARGPLDPALLAVAARGHLAVVTYDGRVLATADPASARLAHTAPVQLAADWADRIAAAIGPPIYPHVLVSTASAFSGLASWYGPGFAGQTTADGEVFDPDLYTAANRWLPFGTLLNVTDIRTGASVLVRINDRGPYVGDRVLDLSQAAARAIGLTGVDPVECTVVSWPTT
jgi:rare lipoprotein A